MAHAWQLCAFITCSVLVSSISASTDENNSNPSSVSYSPVRLATTRGLASSELSKSSSLASDLTSASSTTSMARAGMPTQPNVYHSIIERTAATSQLASPVQATASTVGDLHTAAGHHHGHAHGKYYDYREVPKKKTWKAGYKRGNHKHTIERHEHGKAGKHPHFKAKVKWHDKKSKGKGIHLWDYNHHDKKHYHHG